jgi:hypothetical protein
MTGEEPSIQVGELLSLADPEYMYGAGSIRLRVTMVPRAQLMPGYTEVIGHQILWTGERGDDRVVFVQQAALRTIRARSNVD